MIFSGWQNAQSHPAGKIFGHSCASLASGIVTVGGYASGTGYLKDVFLFRNGWMQWSIVGQMKNVKFVLEILLTNLRINIMEQSLHTRLTLLYSAEDLGIQNLIFLPNFF